LSNSADNQGGGYVTYGAVAELWRCKAKEVLIPGPAGTGKSRGVMEKVNFFLMKYQNSRGLFVRKTRASMSETILPDFEEDVAIGIATGGRQRDNRASYRYPNGSILVLGGMDKQTRIMSSKYDIIAVFEATELTEEDWENLLTRLRSLKGPYRQIIGDCNPQHPTHWLRRRCDRLANAESPMAEIPSTHKDNPKLWDQDKQEWTAFGREYIFGTLGNMTGHRRARLLEGKWAASEGLVYPEFDAAVHVIQAMPEGWESWRRIRSIDFGFVHPWVCQWWAIDGDGRMYLYREIYRAKRTTDEHAAEINALSKGETYDATVTDHDADVRAILDKAGIQSTLAEKAAVAGRDAVHARLRVQGDGRPRLFVLAGCTTEVDADLYEKKRPTSTLAEFDCYVYPPGKDGKSDKEEPIKDNDHGMDAMRYAAMWMDSANKGYGAWVGASTGETKPRGEISSPARDTMTRTELETRMFA